MRDNFIEKGTGFELKPDTPCVYIEIDLRTTGSLREPHTFTKDGYTMSSLAFTETSGAFSTPGATGQSEGRLLLDEKCLLVIPQELLTQENITYTGKYMEPVLVNLDPQQIVAVIATDRGIGMAQNMYPDLDAYTTGQWVLFKDPNAVVGGLTMVPE